MATHAQVARQILAKAPPGVFAHAARDAVVHQNSATLERMFPGVAFAHRKVGPDEWELIGSCADGSVVVWRVGA